ncbi:MAG: MBL fold metallo-hydrolase, partial [Halanaerobium sp.]|nr:MBL fold metallo-hydrolase [Halanaerobium sp.]
EAGGLGASCYLLASGSEAVIIDPGDYLDRAAKVIIQNGLSLKYIINTHGHIDHIQGNNQFKEKLGGELAIHREDAGMLTDPAENLSTLPGLTPFKSLPADRILADGDLLNFGAAELEVIHTPGHTRGSICLLCREEEVLFTGDTLFAYSIGRTDFPHGSREMIDLSLKKLQGLAGGYPGLRIYPGHGGDVAYARVKELNPFIR